MGFYLNILLLRSKEKDFGQTDNPKKVVKKCVMWEIETVLNLDRISAPLNDPLFKSRTAKQRAALHFVDSFYGKLMAQVNAGGTECLAPPFATAKASSEELFPPFLVWQKKFVSAKNGKNVFIHPLGNSVYDQIPSQDFMLEHNDSLRKSKGHGKTSDIVFAKPLVWVPCELLATWVEAGEKAATFVELKKNDKEAVAYFNMWKACVVEMGKVGSRALFLFDHIHLTNVI